MRLIYNAKLSAKLLVSFFILIAAMVFIGIFGIINLNKINSYTDSIYEDNFLPTTYIEDINATTLLARFYTQRIINSTEAERQGHIDLLQGTSGVNTALLEKYEAAVGTSPKLEALRDNLTAYRAERETFVELATEGKIVEANDHNNNVVIPLITKVQDGIAELITDNLAQAENTIQESGQIFDSSILTTAIVIVIVAILALLIGIFISNIITRPLNVVRDVAEKIADGDLTVTLPERYLTQKDEVGLLANNVNDMKKGLLTTVSGIKDSTNVLENAVSSTNGILNALNDRISDTSAATEELSAGMEETGASAEEMNATAAEIERAVENVAEKAEDGSVKSGDIHSRATQLGKDVHESIDKSNQVFKEIKLTLEKALEDSKAVDEINALADAILGITSQTTLLALNASIEAARAGEAGRGFAVVANEISALADNSKNTVTRIQAITKVVMSAVNALAESSTNLLNFVAGDVMDEFNSMLKAADSYTGDAIYISDMTSDLSATSEELLASVQILMRTINEVAAAAQEGARTTTIVAEQTTDISVSASSIVVNMAETEETSKQLVSLVDHFRL